MLVVIALGGNAILKRGDPLEAPLQKNNIILAAQYIAEVARNHKVIVTHGNGPQVGLLALQNEAYPEVAPYPLDVLDAQTEGMIGYLLAQELHNQLEHHEIAALLTQTLVNPNDPEFSKPSKYIGPIYTQEKAESLAKSNHWQFNKDGDHFRRVVPSPLPQAIIETTIITKLLAMDNVLLICAGGGGIPVIQDEKGRLSGIEAVVDKDWASNCLARTVQADAFLMLTDVHAVETHFNTADSRKIRAAHPMHLSQYNFPAGSMGPKIGAAVSFVQAGGQFAAIGCLQEAKKIIDGLAGTRIELNCKNITYYQ